MTENQNKIFDLLTKNKAPMTIAQMAAATGLSEKKVSMVTRDLSFQGEIIISKSNRLQTYAISRVKNDIFPEWLLPTIPDIVAGVARMVTFETEEDRMTT